jgi:hypothetical protein
MACFRCKDDGKYMVCFHFDVLRFCGWGLPGQSLLFGDLLTCSKILDALDYSLLCGLHSVRP